METFMLHDGYDRNKKKKPALKYRYLTLEEARALPVGMRQEFFSNDGTCRLLTINGAVKMWKRDILRTQIPIKYGMYEYSYANNDKDSTGVDVVKPLIKLVREGSDD